MTFYTFTLSNKAGMVWDDGAFFDTYEEAEEAVKTAVMLSSTETSASQRVVFYIVNEKHDEE
jgi:hypothetical protein